MRARLRLEVSTASAAELATLDSSTVSLGARNGLGAAGVGLCKGGTDVKAGGVDGLIVLIIVATFPDPSVQGTRVQASRLWGGAIHVSD